MPMAERRIRGRVALLVVLAVASSVLAGSRSSQAADGPGLRPEPPPPHWAAWDLAPGVQHLQTVRPGLVAYAARVRAGAPVALQPVVAHGRVGSGRQVTSELCRGVGGLVCVNADFFNCPTCGQPAGGLVDKGRVLRSFRHRYPQVSVVDRKLTLEPIGWRGRIDAQVGDLTLELPLASMNRGPATEGVALYTPAWGPTTPQAPGQLEVVLSAGRGFRDGTVHLTPVRRRPVAGGIPRDGVVLAAHGRAAAMLDRLVDAWNRQPAAARRFVIETGLTTAAELSVGARPVLLRRGVRQRLDPRDGMVARRHPRTLVGWTARGDLLFVTVDGRQPGYSNGATLQEAAGLLLELGAVDGVNLDGGGSSTFVLRCPRGACVRNRPSDGRERAVPVALAVVPASPFRPATLAVR